MRLVTGRLVTDLRSMNVTMLNQTANQPNRKATEPNRRRTKENTEPRSSLLEVLRSWLGTMPYVCSPSEWFSLRGEASQIGNYGPITGLLSPGVGMLRSFELSFPPPGEVCSIFAEGGTDSAVPRV